MRDREKENGLEKLPSAVPRPSCLTSGRFGDGFIAVAVVVTELENLLIRGCAPIKLTSKKNDYVKSLFTSTLDHYNGRESFKGSGYYF